MDDQNDQNQNPAPVAGATDEPISPDSPSSEAGGGLGEPPPATPVAETPTTVAPSTPVGGSVEEKCTTCGGASNAGNCTSCGQNQYGCTCQRSGAPA